MAAEARVTGEWDRAALVAATIHNVNCVRKSDMVSPASINPMRARKQDVLHVTKDLSILKKLYVKGQ